MKSTSAFTLVELLAGISIVALLAAVTIPAMNRARESALVMKCSENLRQLGLAVIQYSSDHGMVFPETSHQEAEGGVSWTQALQPYAGGTVTFKCPKDFRSTRERTYVMNDFLTPNPCGAPYLNFSRRVLVERPSETILYAEANPTAVIPDHFHFSEYHGGTIPDADFEALVAVRGHSGRANYAFADGHVEQLGWAEVRQRLANPKSRFIDPTK